MKYFIDTEFKEYFKQHKLLGIKVGYPTPTINLISIGIVCEDSREYYALNKECDLNEICKDTWLWEHVITPIYIEHVHGDARNYLGLNNNTIKSIFRDSGKSRQEIANEVFAFVNPISEEGSLNDNQWNKHLNKYRVLASENRSIDFYGYHADYDWVVFCQLFGKMMDLPKGFPMYCKDLKQMFDEKADSMSSEQLSKIEYPSVTHNVLEYLDKTGMIDKAKHLKTHPLYPKQEDEHNALADAKWNQKLYNFILNI